MKNWDFPILVLQTYSTRSPGMVPKDNGILPFILLPLKFLFDQTKVYLCQAKIIVPVLS